MNPEANLRKSLIRTAAELPKGSQERKALLGLLGAPQQKVAGLPRATRRPPGPKFRQSVVEWMRADIQTKLEAGGVAQKQIDILIRRLPEVVTDTSYSGGYGSGGFKNFETQQDAVDWLSGKLSLKWGGSYPKELALTITRYGAGNDAIRDKARGMANKMKYWQKALAMVALGATSSRKSFHLDPKGMADELDERIARSSGDTLQNMYPFLEWAAKVPKPPASMVW